MCYVTIHVQITILSHICKDTVNLEIFPLRVTYPLTVSLVFGGDPSASGSVTVGAFRKLVTAVSL